MLTVFGGFNTFVLQATDILVEVPNSNTTITWACILSDLWLGVDLRMDTRKDMCSKYFGLCAHNMLSALGSK